MKFENTSVFNFKNAFRGMRNPLNSWNKCDSFFGTIENDSDKIVRIVDLWVKDKYPDYNGFETTKEEQSCFDNILAYIKSNCILDTDKTLHSVAVIGPNDMKLATNLIKGGSEHRKFLRQIFVSVDITAPLYWWKEMDTYKVGTVSNSTSTMHTLTKNPITMDCFEMDDYNEDVGMTAYWRIVIEELEALRQEVVDEKDAVKSKKLWKELIRALPESWLQTRTITFNYENLLSICSQRKFHKLNEWSESFISWAKTLPYAKDFIFNDRDGLNYL